MKMMRIKMRIMVQLRESAKDWDTTVNYNEGPSCLSKQETFRGVSCGKGQGVCKDLGLYE
jgi:hypothetical protein